MMKRLLAVLLLAGCAANAQTPPPTVSAAALHRHPLYSTLAQYDRQIAALRATLHTPEFKNSTAQINNAIASLRGDIDATAASINTLVSQKADAYAARQDAAVSALLANANANAPTPSDVRAHLQQAYEAEYADLRNGSDSDMAHYRDTLLSQQNTAYQTYVQSIQRRTQQAYAARAQELREKESALLLERARRDSAERLELRAQLQTLYLRPARRRQLEAQLNALQKRDDRALGELRARDAGTLAAYRETLLTQADRDIAHMNGELQARTAANLATRRDVLTAQHAAPASLPLSAQPGGTAAGRAADLRAEVAALRNNGRKQFQADADTTQAAYAGARDDLTRRFAALRDEDAASARDTWAQIAALQRDRQELYDQIVRSLTSPASR